MTEEVDNNENNHAKNANGNSTDAEYAVEIPQQSTNNNANNNNSMTEKEEKMMTVVVNTNLMLYRFFPIGSYQIIFDVDKSVATITGKATWCCCCCCWCPTQSHTIGLQQEVTTNLRVQQEYFCCNDCGRFLRDASLSFALAFLFHLIPSIIWGAEQSLGSPTNHQLMGAVWFAGWPIWFILLQFLRPWGIEITTKQTTKDDMNEFFDDVIFIPFASRKHATDIVAWWQDIQQQLQHQQQQQSSSGSPVPVPPPPLPEKPRLITDPQFLIGWFVFLVLMVNMIVTGVLVMQCNNRGCCKDNEDTLDCCVETGYPEC